MTPPTFFYFDLGKVLVNFSVERMLAQVGEAAGISTDQARDAVLHADLLRRHETGQLSGPEFYEAFCNQIDRRPDYNRLVAAVSEIFELNVSIVPLVSQLRQAGCALGVLSNTGPLHWDYCLGQYRMLSDLFDVHALSYRIGVMKPDAVIFDRAAKMAGVRPEKIFFVDDLAENVAGARMAGFDAVQYTTTASLVAELGRRGVHLNY